MSLIVSMLRERSKIQSKKTKQTPLKKSREMAAIRSRKMVISIREGDYGHEGTHSGAGVSEELATFHPLASEAINTLLLYDCTLICVRALFQIYITFYNQNKLLYLPQLFNVASCQISQI